MENKFAHISNDAHQALKRSQLKNGDILFSIAGALGRTAIVNKNILPANTNQALSIIRLKDDNNILNEYILRALTSGYVLQQVENFKGGVAQQNLSLGQMKRFEIPIPSIKKQKQIVKKLDKFSDHIKKLESTYNQKLLDLEDLKKSILDKAFKGEL